MNDNTPDDIADGKTSAKKGYSIWSLLVIMTLLAVWMAVPRLSANGRTYGAVLFFTFHQIAGWILISSLIWAGTGKRRLVLGMLTTVMFVAWLPALCVIITEPFSGHSIVGEVLTKVGLIDAYTFFYDYLDQRFGYGLAAH